MESLIFSGVQQLSTALIEIDNVPDDSSVNILNVIYD